MTVHALRRTIGDEAFFELLKTWTAEQRDGNATTDEFIAAAEQVSGKELTRSSTPGSSARQAPPKP